MSARTTYTMSQLLALRNSNTRRPQELPSIPGVTTPPRKSPRLFNVNDPCKPFILDRFHHDDDHTPSAAMLTVC